MSFFVHQVSKIVCWLFYAEICSSTPVFVPCRHNFGKQLLYLTYFQLLYRNNSTCNVIFCLTSCRTRCQVQSDVFKIYSYCINGLNFAPQLHSFKHLLQLLISLSLNFPCIQSALSAFAQLCCCKTPSPASQLRFRRSHFTAQAQSKQRKSKVQVFSLMHD